MAHYKSGGVRTAVYSSFRGADFSTDPALVDPCRSPLCTNMIADAGGMPEKRPGWRVLQELGAQIFGLFSGEFDGERHYLAHAGNAIYRWDETDAAPVLLRSGVARKKSRGVNLCGKIWIVTGREYLVYDGSTLQRVADGACYVPTVFITRQPTGGGELLENVNLLTPRRKESFQTNGTATVFLLSSSADAGSSVRVWVQGTEKTEGTDFTVNRAAGRITFSVPPDAVNGEDGLLVEYSHTTASHIQRVEHSRIITLFGVGSSDRVFLAGDPDHPNLDCWSERNDPTYFPELNYAEVGSAACAIRGYCRIGAYQAIVKEDNGEDSTVFLRSGEMSADGEAVFALKAAFSGVGAVAEGSFASLLDDALFLSGTGVHAISLNDGNGERSTQNRSFFVNPSLLRESELARAEAAAWNGLYLLALPNGHVYVLDARQKKCYRSASMGDFVYECCYWENIPAVCFLRTEDGGGEWLYFGTAEGKICKMNTDDPSLNRYADDGEAIHAVWATRFDDDGAPGRLKTLLKKGCCVTIKPYSRSSGTVYFRTDRNSGLEVPVTRDVMDRFSFEDIDFERFTFGGDDGPQEIFLRHRVKDYRRMQIIVRNDELREGFGVYQITKYFVYGNYARAPKSTALLSDREQETDEALSLRIREIFEDIYGTDTWLEGEENG